MKKDQIAVALNLMLMPAGVYFAECSMFVLAFAVLAAQIVLIFAQIKLEKM